MRKVFVDSNGNVVLRGEAKKIPESAAPVFAPENPTPVSRRNPDYNFFCRFCGTGFELKSHLWSHEPDCGMAHGCKKCNKCYVVFEDAEEYKTHDCEEMLIQQFGVHRAKNILSRNIKKR